MTTIHFPDLAFLLTLACAWRYGRRCRNIACYGRPSSPNVPARDRRTGRDVADFGGPSYVFLALDHDGRRSSPRARWQCLADQCRDHLPRLILVVLRMASHS